MNMKNSEVAILLRRLVGVITLLSLAAATFALVTTGIVPGRYLWLVWPIYVVLTLVVVWVATRRQARWKGAITASVVVALLLTAANLWVHVTMQNTGVFLSSLQQPRTSFVEYSIIAKKDAQMTLQRAASAGMITHDATYDDAVSALAHETTAEPVRHDNLTSVITALMNGENDLSAIRTANLVLVQENTPDTYAGIVVLGTFKVRTTQPDAPAVDVSKPFVLYISGMDTYGDINGAARSDVNMLVVVNPVERKLLLVNTPRDYYVQLHGTTGQRDKLTHAGVYGVDVSRQTLADLYDVEIPAYVRLNFTSLVKVVDTIGPIEVYSAHDFRSFHRGYNTLDSTRALEFARERYSFEGGDRERGRNQQRVIEAIVTKMSEPQNILRYNTILAQLQGSLQTNVSSDAITSLANAQLNDMKRWHVESINVDGTGAMQPTYSMGALPLYVMIPNEQDVEWARVKIRNYLQ